MECPHCNYVDGWSSKIQKEETGSEGTFFMLETSMYRQHEESWRPDEKRNVFACPNCRKLFIGD